ncbi:PilT/PilU family type 4a pilus ATPase [Alicyclobacillus sp. ALC3]|nr:PilT/PilU family type 4a pilus ATPase [Alicyclobacillus sp. ALC3]
MSSNVDGSGTVSNEANVTTGSEWQQVEGALWLQEAANAGASDLHVTPGGFLMARVDGRLVRRSEVRVPTDVAREFAQGLVGQGGWETLQQTGQVDVSFVLQDGLRCRVHAYRTNAGISVTARIIPASVPDFHTLGLPRQVLNFIYQSQGLALLTGPTGCGKSTTLAALVNELNHSLPKHVVTLEDPIEFVFENDVALIEQREIGLHTQSFQTGLRSALRQVPDVIVVGEMRDLETISTAVTAAETGHLVLATLHAPDAAEAVHRIIDVFEPRQQAQIRTQLAGVLLGVVTQSLLPHASGHGRVPVCDVLVNTSAVSNLIRTDKVHQLQTAMQTGRQFGMQTMDMHREELIRLGAITSTQTAAQSVSAVGHTL